MSVEGWYGMVGHLRITIFHTKFIFRNVSGISLTNSSSQIMLFTYRTVILVYNNLIHHYIVRPVVRTYEFMHRIYGLTIDEGSRL